MDILTTLPTDTFVSSAFAELLADVTNLLASAQQQKPQDKEEISFWRRQLNALNKAEYNHTQGVRLVVTDGAYLLPSASRPGALVHRLTKHGGIVVCSCEAGVKGTLCWHHMLVNVLERAAELESRDVIEAEISGSGPDTEAGNPVPHAPEAAAWLGAQITLAQRLAATAQYLDALRSAQGRRALFLDPPIDIPQEPQPPTPGGPGPVDDWPKRAGRSLGLRLVQARKRSAYFTSALYLEAA